MKKFLLTLLSQLLIIPLLLGQFSTIEISNKKDSLNIHIPDTTKAMLLSQLSNAYQYSNLDSCLAFAKRALSFSQEINFTRGKGFALYRLGAAYRQMGNLPQAMQNELLALEIANKIHDYKLKAGALNTIGNIYSELGDNRTAIQYYFDAKRDYEKIFYEPGIIKELSNIGIAYGRIGRLDSALNFLTEAYTRKLKSGNRTEVAFTAVLEALGRVYNDLGKDSLSLHCYNMAVKESFVDNDSRNRASTYLSMALLFKKLNYPDSSLLYASQALADAQTSSYRRILLNASNLVSDLFKADHKIDSAFKYLELAQQASDTLFGLNKFQQLQQILLNEQAVHQELQQEKEKLKSNYRLVASLSGIVIALIILIILWRNNLKQRKSNWQLSKQKEQIAIQNKNLELTLENLKSTQSQLIQSEKMASLGELTAGIAHEIQNPLNFVNNFSDVNKELIAELKAEIKNGNIEEVNAIAGDIEANEEKINHHGKRADAIVKNMLQHSRKSTGQKEPTDINALADEYIRLAYHGMRAKDKSFNVNIKTDFDKTIGTINIIPQDIGRVILNLVNNAFYAATQPSEGGLLETDFTKTPTVLVKTRKDDNKVLISVKDNGSGIPANILDKIFQPFFTTKPTGQGTGLGLSLSYDIVKAHGGELKVETKEGEGTTFLIELPFSNKYE